MFQAVAPNGWAGLPKDAFHLPSSAFSIFPVNGLESHSRLKFV